MKTLKTLILFSFLFVCGMSASADNKSNLIYNSEEVNGVKVAETVYKMDGSTLANYMVTSAPACSGCSTTTIICSKASSVSFIMKWICSYCFSVKS